MVSVPAEREEVCNINIQNFQEAANADGYRDEQGRKLVEDGKDGPNTQYVRRQICLQAKRVGLIYKVGSTGAVVKWWQTRCNEILGGNQDTDGRYGKTARTETIKLQKSLISQPMVRRDITACRRHSIIDGSAEGMVL